jgi:hypothetical protein
MRTVRLRGGLGNQLFGMAFAHSVKHLAGEPVAIDVSGFRQDRYHRTFVTGDLAADLGHQVVSRPSFRGVMRRLPFHGQIMEGRSAAQLGDIAVPGRYFDGYWQNERYIASREFIRIRTRKFLEMKSARADAHDIVIHQRGYREEALPSRRSGPSADYVARATDLIERRHGHTRDIVVISDTRPDADPFADMALLLRARALILANSSFSWWAGYCGDATTVTYPERNGAFHYPAPAQRFVVV